MVAFRHSAVLPSGVALHDHLRRVSRLENEAVLDRMALGQ